MRVCPECDFKTEEPNCPRDGRPTVDEAVLNPEEAVDPLIGREIEGKYIVREQLGVGGYGAVYLAEHATTGGSIALKVLRSNLLSSKGALRRFYLEGQNTHRLSHHNTVRLFDFGRTEDGLHFMAMEYVRGRTIASVLDDEGGLSPDRVVRISEQILRSLGEAHELEIVHRDIKPQNVMLVDQYGERDFVKVLDFGVSRSLDSTGAGTQGIIGTPQYMAPELWEGGAIDGRADLYAVGCMMYQMLAGRLPWVVVGDKESVMRWASAHVLEPPPDLLAVAPGACTPELASVVMRLIAKAPAARPPTAADVLALLAATREVRTTAEFRAVESGGSLETGPDLPHHAGLRRPDKTSVDALAGLNANTLDFDDDGVPPSQRVPAAIAQPVGATDRPAGRRSLLLAGGAAVVAAAVLLFLAVSGGKGEGVHKTGSPGLAAAPPAAATADNPRSEAPPVSHAVSESAGERPVPPVAADAVVAPEQAAIGKLVLESEPQGAAVFDAADTKLGETPWEVPVELRRRNAELTLRLAEFQSSIVTLAEPTDKPFERQRVMLRPLPRVKFVSTPSGATVVSLRDGSELGQTPLVWRVPAEIVEQLATGEPFEVEFRRRGYDSTKAPLDDKEVADGYSTLDLRLTRQQARPPKAEEPKKAGGWAL